MDTEKDKKITVISFDDSNNVEQGSKGETTLTNTKKKGIDSTRQTRGGFGGFAQKAEEQN